MADGGKRETKGIVDDEDTRQAAVANQENRTSQWSNLPRELLNLIMEKLFFTDRIRFRAVCKDWRIPIGGRPSNELPWVLTYKLFDSVGRTKVMLSDPVHKRTHTIANFASIMGEYLNLFYDSCICGSKCGWLVFENHKRDNGVSIFLYSPFTNNVIMLPSIFCSMNYQATFSSTNPLSTFSSTNPLSTDCVFVFTCSDLRGLEISTYRNGDKEWRSKIIDVDFKGPVDSLVCTDKGLCYLILPCGKLGAFVVESQEWSWLVESRWIGKDYMHLIEFYGDLFLAKGPAHWEVRKYSFNEPREVFKYDEKERGWIEQKSLGDKALFLNFYGSSSYLRPVFGDTTDLADKMFYIGDDHENVTKVRVYSLKDVKHDIQNRAYDWMGRDSLAKILIEPPY